MNERACVLSVLQPAPSLDQHPLDSVYRRIDDENNRRNQRLQKVRVLIRPIDRAAGRDHIDVERCQGCDCEYLQASSGIAREQHAQR